MTAQAPVERHDPLPDHKLVLAPVRVPSWALRRLVQHFRGAANPSTAAPRAESRRF